jgi:Flp pilus assembly protein TadB
VTAPLAGALLLSALTGVTVSWLFIAWPRRMSAEEWVVHRRSFQNAHDAAKPAGRFSILRAGSRAGSAAAVRILPQADLALLQIARGSAPTTQENALRRLALLAGGAALGVIIVATIGGIATQSTWLALAAPILALLAAAVAATGQWVSWRFEAARIRGAIRKDLPRLLTGARVLLDSGTANAEQALAAAVGTYADPAAELLREALRYKEVRRVDFEAAVDEVADRYAVGELHRLADSLRVGHRYGTGISALLVDFAQRARSSWHASYRERITRAPVLMTVPALIFFVLPLLVLVMFLVFTPLMGTLSRL